LETERQRYLELFNFAPDGYLVTDVDGVIQEANLAAGMLLGVAVEHLTGRLLESFVHEPERQAFRAQLTAMPMRRRMHYWEVCLQPNVSAPVLVSLRVGVIRGAGQ